MPRHVVLLRGINLARHRRISMPELRRALESGGFVEVETYVQSGNVVLSSPVSPPRVAKQVNAMIAQRFGFDVVVLVRSHAELAQVVRRNPLREVVTDPKRYLVTFLSDELPASTIGRMGEVAGPHEQFAAIGREVYSWHPTGVGRSPLWERLAAKGLGVDATTRNWTTVTALHEMAAR